MHDYDCEECTAERIRSELSKAKAQYQRSESILGADAKVAVQTPLAELDERINTAIVRIYDVVGQLNEHAERLHGQADSNEKEVAGHRPTGGTLDSLDASVDRLFGVIDRVAQAAERNINIA